MKITLIFIVTFFCFSSIANSGNLLDDINKNKKERDKFVDVGPRRDKPREHIVDPYLVERKKNKKNYKHDCKYKEFKTMGEYESCVDKFYDAYKKDYPNRGTEQYGDKFYSNLSKDEGKAKRDELLKQLDWVSHHPKNGNEGIELLVKHLLREIAFIERYVMKINPRHYETR